MCKRNYKITPKEFSFGTSYQVEVWDTYGRYTEVYEKDVVSAWKFIYDYWSKEEKNKNSDELMCMLGRGTFGLIVFSLVTIIKEVV